MASARTQYLAFGFLAITDVSRYLDMVTYLLYEALGDRGSRVRFPAGARNLSLHHRGQNGSGAHPASYPMGTRDSFPRGKAGGVKLTTHPHLARGQECVEPYLHSHNTSSWRGAYLS
jgi:hypothetical protein